MPLLDSTLLPRVVIVVCVDRLLEPLVRTWFLGIVSVARLSVVLCAV